MSGSRYPWFKFVPADWRSDPLLRICSLAARGLWVECMCLMHEATPYGHLCVNGHAVTDTQLAMLVGAPPDQVPELLGELESAGVFSRTTKGVIYSRRMVRDEKKARSARRNGKSGGNPTLSGKRENRAPDKPPDKPPDKGRDKPKTLDHRPKTQDGKRESPSSSTEPGAARAGPGGDAVDDDGDRDSPAVSPERRVVAAMDDARQARFGRRRRAVAPGDLPTARRWLAAGATPDLCAEVFAVVCAKAPAPPNSLAYFDEAVALALAAGLPRGGDGRPMTARVRARYERILGEMGDEDDG